MRSGQNNRGIVTIEFRVDSDVQQHLIAVSPRGKLRPQHAACVTTGKHIRGVQVQPRTQVARRNFIPQVAMQFGQFFDSPIQPCSAAFSIQE